MPENATGTLEVDDGGIVIDLQHISKAFGAGEDSIDALSDVSLQVRRGQIFGVIGYSGAGKSTLIRMVNALERPSSGRALVEGTDVQTLGAADLRAFKKRTGMIFQHFNLLDSLTVRANVALPLSLDGADRAVQAARVAEVLAFVGLADKADVYPAELSGGQKQRVGIARAIVRNPAVLLCDEATSALDPATTRQIIDLLRRINAEYGVTILIVTHEMDVIKDLCDEVAVMDSGRVVERGSVLQVFLHPTTATTRSFVSDVLPSELPEVVAAQAGGATVWKLLFEGQQASAPLLSALVKEYDLTVNIMYANMTTIQQRTVGQLIVQIDGAVDAEDAARAALTAAGIQIERL